MSVKWYDQITNAAVKKKKQFCLIYHALLIADRRHSVFGHIFVVRFSSTLSTEALDGTLPVETGSANWVDQEEHGVNIYKTEAFGQFAVDFAGYAGRYSLRGSVNQVIVDRVGSLF